MFLTIGMCRVGTLPLRWSYGGVDASNARRVGVTAERKATSSVPVRPFWGVGYVWAYPRHTHGHLSVSCDTQRALLLRIDTSSYVAL